jgi:hypothetical protein
MKISFTVGRTLAVAGAAVALVAAVTAIATPAKAAPTAGGWWSTARAEAVVANLSAGDSPRGCERKILSSDWVGTCVVSGAAGKCEGFGPRSIHPTEDVYLYETFKCSLPSTIWTGARLKSARRQMKPEVCKPGPWFGREAAYNACLRGRGLYGDAAYAAMTTMLDNRDLLNRVPRPTATTIRVQVTDRFTAHVSWLGTTWKMTIRPTDG